MRPRSWSGCGPSCVITDLEMPRAGGRSVVAAAVQKRVPVVVLTGHATVAAAVELMRAGASNFLTKPFTPETLRALLADTFGRGDRAASGSVVGEEHSFKEVLDVVAAVAETDATVLISGESGTGKEVVARSIHRASKRADGPFIAVNCGAIPEALLESELFGHARGAFTGATHARAGRFQLAEGGTLFLDEIGDMPLQFQVKLLRVIQERQYEVVGDELAAHGRRARHRAPPIATSQAMVKAGTLPRGSLLSPQPHRREAAGAARAAGRHSAAGRALRRRVQRRATAPTSTASSPALLDALARHRWPGNVRELGNVVERMVIFQKRGQLQLDALPPAVLKAQGETNAAAPAGAAPRRPRAKSRRSCRPKGSTCAQRWRRSRTR